MRLFRYDSCARRPSRAKEIVAQASSPLWTAAELRAEAEALLTRAAKLADDQELLDEPF